jgi:Rps23 Pro-64 3,4-dihydroxylase Tpa1-like proline 4-hydroxylase
MSVAKAVSADSIAPEKLAAILKDGREQFSNAAPFPNIVVDDFLRPEVADAVLSEFRIPDADTVYYSHYNNQTLGLTKLAQMGPVTQRVFQDFQSPAFIAFLEQLTGIPDLLADPDLDGAGLHETKRGGYLNMHVDFLAHTLRKNWSRQLNVLLFLNKRWKPEYNGYLEFWDMKEKRCFQKIEPAFNRCVIFRTDRRSFHGYPAGLQCPDDHTRKSLAFYYYRDEHKPCSLTPTYYQYLPNDSLWRKGLIVGDRFALRVYSYLKRYSLMSDKVVSKVTRLYRRRTRD